MESETNILIVDDDESTCKIMSLILKNSGYMIETVGTGKEAAAKALEKFFNLALLDINLPDMKGVELIGVLKEKHPDIEVIMITGHASLETAIRALNEGASFYITKPLNMDEVLATIRGFLEKQRLTMENRRLFREVQHELAERKRAEEELRQHHDHLEEMVKERTAKLLREIAERKRAEKKIKAALKEKELLLKEIHHRVRNNMQIISSMLSIQEIQIKDQAAQRVFRESWTRIRSMSLVHEKLYQSEDFTKINFEEYTKSLTADLFLTYDVDPDNIKLKRNIKDVYLDINIAIPCGMIISELVSNSLKYAFRKGQKGEITINFISTNNVYELTVGDDGKGLPKYLDFRNAESLGLQLVRLFCKKIDANIKLNRGKGTSFKIVFKGGEDQREG